MAMGPNFVRTMLKLGQEKETKSKSSMINMVAPTSAMDLAEAIFAFLSRQSVMGRITR